jgi:NADH-quinone oxidoreductase subunit L
MQTTYLGYIILAPLLGFVLLSALYIASFRVTIPKILYTVIAITMPIVSFIFALLLFIGALNENNLYHQMLFTWFHIDVYTINVALLGDHLSLFMTLFITFIGGLIHIYATGYMKDEEGYGKFFAYFHLFMASMLLLVLADSPVMMFVGWEGVGLCSYLLISYYHHGNENVKAGNKAFVANRVGDFGFLIGLSLLFITIGQYGFSYEALSAHIGEISFSMLTAIGLLLFVGAMGKSAQIPLYVWLPDAMAGPTPVSALIHAATMVTAGVYMVARFAFLYDLIPQVGLFIASLGALSALFAAVIALQQRDIKKILAYSTMSQLGYMFVGVGLGAYDAGIFHVFTHAFFKALLFLGAGSVIVALHHEQDIFKMGALRKKLPLTFITMSIATLALAGIPPFSGFFSKDAIMMTAFASGHYLIWLATFITAGLTAYYMTRLMVLTFITPVKKEHHIHSVTFGMQGVLAVLAVGAVFASVAGFPTIFGGNNFLGSWMNVEVKHHISHSSEYLLMAANVSVGLFGIFIGYRRFATKRIEPNAKSIIANKFYIDELFDAVLIRPLKRTSIILTHTIDIGLIDRILYLLSNGYHHLGDKAALMQNGHVRTYALYMLIGISLAFIYISWLV